MTTRPTSRTHALAAGAQRERGVLLDDEDGEAVLAVQALEDLEDLADDHRREPERRLVEHQQARARHQRAAEGEHLLLAAGERPGRLPLALGEPGEELEHAPAVGVGVAVAADVRAELQVLADGELADHPAALGHVRDAEPRDRLGRAAGDRPPVEANLARLAHRVRDRAQRRRLAGSVRAEHGDHLALRHLERHAVQRVHGPVAGVDPLELEERHSTRSTSSVPR